MLFSVISRVSEKSYVLEIKQLRFLTFVRNDIVANCDTASKGRGLKGGGNTI